MGPGRVRAVEPGACRVEEYVDGGLLGRGGAPPTLTGYSGRRRYRREETEVLAHPAPCPGGRTAGLAGAILGSGPRLPRRRGREAPPGITRGGPGGRITLPARLSPDP